MKIISKYKDYYDYLQGVWGMDEKLTLDRTDYSVTPNFKESVCPHLSIVRFYICGWVVEGLYYQEKWNKEGVFLYGEEILRELSDRVIDTNNKRTWMDDPRYYVVDPFNEREHYIYVLKQPVKYFDLDHNPKGYYQEKRAVECPNEASNCPILIEEKPQKKKYGLPNCDRFPILRDYHIHKIYDPQTMWLMLGEWLGRVKDIPNNQTNEEKVVSNGFDAKTSFRNPINSRK